MTIFFSGKSWRLTERKTTWRVSREEGVLRVAYIIPKTAAPDVSAVKAYISQHADLF